MIKKNYTALGLCMISFFCIAQSQEHKAVIIVPITDLLGQSLASFNKAHKTKLTYATIPISGKNENKACPRLHQLLFNKVVTVLETQKDEVKVQVPNHFCQTDHSPTKQNTYWMAKKDLITFDTLEKHGINTTTIPTPLSFDDIQTYHPDVVTLKNPITDSSRGITYSAGTRFVKTPTQPHKHYVTVHVLNPITMKVERMALPQRQLSVYHQKPEEKIKEYVATIRSWAHEKKGFIPYVWGGCSYTTLCHHRPFQEKNDADNHPYYQRKERLTGTQDGLDCSGLILRGTQLCGIPYFYKNSTTLAKNLASLQKHDPIENGDIIWFSGHVIVVSDVKNNLVVEARGYEHGYGVVQETSLKEQFKTITTYDQLKQAYLEQKPIERLDKSGTTVKTLTNYKILKLKSVWHSAGHDKHNQ